MVSHGFGCEIVQLPETGGKQCKCMVKLRDDFPCNSALFGLEM